MMMRRVLWLAALGCLSLAVEASAGVWTYARSSDALDETVSPGTHASSFASNAQTAAYASANLATGNLQVYAAASGGFPLAASSYAQFSDRLTFSAPGATSQSGIPIGVAFSFHGVATIPDFLGTDRGSFNTSAVARFGNGQGQFYRQQNSHPQAAAEYYEFHSGWNSFSYTQSADEQTFYAVYLLTATDVVVDVFASLSASLDRNAMFDARNSVNFSLLLPDDVTFTSQSGAFLTEASSVPEPATWGAFSIGLGAIVAMRRRTNQRKKAA